jgi:hypothetical protein
VPAGRSWKIVSLAATAMVVPALVIACAGRPAGEAEPAAVSGSPQFVPDTKPPPPVRWVDVEVPAGTPLKTVMLQRVGVGTSRPGDRFEAKVTEAVVVGDFVAIPAGSIAHGVVAEATPGRTAPGGGGSLTLVIDRLSTPTGASAELQARYRRRGADADMAIDRDAPLIVRLEKTLSIQVKR